MDILIDLIDHMAGVKEGLGVNVIDVELFYSFLKEWGFAWLVILIFFTIWGFNWVFGQKGSRTF